MSLPTEQISITDENEIDLGSDRLQLETQAWYTLAKYSQIPPSLFVETLDSAERTYIVQRRLRRATELGFPSEIRLTIDSQNRVIGLSDARLLQIDIPELISMVIESLPPELSPQEVAVDSYLDANDEFELRLFSPEITTEPRPGDVINGGVYIRHSVTGDFGIQVFCFLRRLICSNGMISHVCLSDKHARARRLSKDCHEIEDMRVQTRRLIGEAWSQLENKLAALAELLHRPSVDVGILQQQRTRLSLNNRTIHLIEAAINEDEMPLTGTSFDLINAIARVATHEDSLSTRQRRTLLRAAGEFSQFHVHRCPSCGRWLKNRSARESSGNERGAA